MNALVTRSGSMTSSAALTRCVVLRLFRVDTEGVLEQLERYVGLLTSDELATMLLREGLHSVGLE